jgi:predicted enzyme related to lactoylglutathione lyase
MSWIPNAYARGDLVVVVDCADLERAARFWTGALGYVTKLGATVLTSHPIIEHGWTWHMLADPDGNEFCVLRPSPEYWPDR